MACGCGRVGLAEDVMQRVRRAGFDVVQELPLADGGEGTLEAIQAVLPRLNTYADGAARALRSRIAEHLGVGELHTRGFVAVVPQDLVTWTRVCGERVEALMRAYGYSTGER